MAVPFVVAEMIRRRRGTSNMRTRNEAIWPRVTSPSGQKRPPPHPLVIPSCREPFDLVAERRVANIGEGARRRHRWPGQREAPDADDGRHGGGRDPIVRRMSPAPWRFEGTRWARLAAGPSITGSTVGLSPQGSREPARPVEEGRHLATGHDAVRAERRRSAAVGDVGFRHAVDVGLVGVALVIGEEVGRGTRGGCRHVTGTWPSAPGSPGHSGRTCSGRSLR